MVVHLVFLQFNEKLNLNVSLGVAYPDTKSTNLFLKLRYYLILQSRKAMDEALLCNKKCLTFILHNIPWRAFVFYNFLTFQVQFYPRVCIQRPTDKLRVSPYGCSRRVYGLGQNPTEKIEKEMDSHIKMWH